MLITVRTSTESSFTVTASPLMTVSELVRLCADHPNLPSPFKLIHNGRRLSPPDLTLDAAGVQNDTALILMEALPRPKRPKRARCAMLKCSSAPLRMVGDCSGCHSSFCAQHRLMENHHCVGLQQCKDSAHMRNAVKLKQESTINT